MLNFTFKEWLCTYQKYHL